jgi:hypothetical protein
MNNGNLNMAVSDLLRVASSGITYARRDIEIMKGYGVNEAFINTLETDNNRLKDTPTDEELQEVVSLVTRDKDLKAEQVRSYIRSFMVRAKNVFGADSAELKGFSAMDLSRMNDNELVRTGRAVKRMSLNKLDMLSGKGLTAELVEAFGVQVEEFDHVIDDFNDAYNAYHEGTASRHKLALKVYNQVSEIFDYGKNYWRGKSELRFADYVIFDTSHNKHHKATGSLSGRVTHEENSTPISGATIEMAGTKLTTTTDSAGYYMFKEAPSGRHTIKCSASGMKPLERANIAIKDNNDIDCDFQLISE